MNARVVMRFKKEHRDWQQISLVKLLAQTIEHVANRIGNGFDEAYSFMV